MVTPGELVLNPPCNILLDTSQSDRSTVSKGQPLSIACILTTALGEISESPVIVVKLGQYINIYFIVISDVCDIFQPDRLIVFAPQPLNILSNVKQFDKSIFDISIEDTLRQQ